MKMSKIKTLLLFALALAAQAVTANEKANMKYELVPLDYPYDALEPYIDAETVKFHHDKHQATYVANLNAALEAVPDFKAPECLGKLIANLESVPESARNAVRNNGGGVWNHTFYWKGLSPKKTEICPELAKAIDRDFGSFENFKEKLSKAAIGQFGSGWGWLICDKEGKLSVVSTPNQDCPLMGKIANTCGNTPLLAIDIWEHAYYLKYKNLRADYVKNIWNIINWDEVCKRYKKALEKGAECSGGTCAAK